ncbi:hypothetical protein [Streptomyces chartreusis]
MDSTTGVLLQYGALGVLAVLALAAVRVLFARLTAQLDQQTERGDRLEEELRKLNETVRSDYIANLNRATQAISDANRATADALAAVRRS